MSAEANVKIVQEMYRAFLRRDVPGILVYLDDDIIWTVPGSSAVPMAGVRKRLTEVRQFFETVENMLEFRLFKPREYIAQGNRVVTLVRYEGRNKSTGREFALIPRWPGPSRMERRWRSRSTQTLRHLRILR